MYCSLLAQNNNIPLDSSKANSVKILFNPFVFDYRWWNDLEYITLEYERRLKKAFTFSSYFTYKPKIKFGYYSNYYVSTIDKYNIKNGNAYELVFIGKRYIGKRKHNSNGLYFGLGVGGNLINNTMLSDEKKMYFAPRIGIFSGYQYSFKRFSFDFRFLNFYYFKVINKNYAHSSNISQYRLYLGIGYSF